MIPDAGYQIPDIKDKKIYDTLNFRLRTLDFESET